MLRLGRIRIILDLDRHRPVYAQRTVPGLRRGWVYHVWVWPLCFEINTSDMSLP